MSSQSRPERFKDRRYPFLLVLMLGMLLGCEPTDHRRHLIAAEQTEAARKSLSPAAQAVMERLSNLGALPVGDVRYHGDDLPNGSGVNLDDSSWMTIQMRYIASAENGDALILRFYEWVGTEGEVRIQVPEGAKSARSANLLEIREGSRLNIESRKIITVPTHPYEIVTVRVKYPIPTQ